MSAHVMGTTGINYCSGTVMDLQEYGRCFIEMGNMQYHQCQQLAKLAIHVSSQQATRPITKVQCSKAGVLIVPSLAVHGINSVQSFPIWKVQFHHMQLSDSFHCIKFVTAETSTHVSCMRTNIAKLHRHKNVLMQDTYNFKIGSIAMLYKTHCHFFWNTKVMW